MACRRERRIRRRPEWFRPLTCLVGMHDGQAFNLGTISPATNRHIRSVIRSRQGSTWTRFEPKRQCLVHPLTSRAKNVVLRNASDLSGDDGSSSEIPDTLGPTAPEGVTPEAWERVTRSARDKWVEDERLSPSPNHSPRHVAAVTLEALRRNDDPRLNHGCEVAIRLSSSSNPASGFTPAGMRAYLDDPKLPFYRILGTWDQMESGGDLQIQSDGRKAYQQLRVRRDGDSRWSTVNFDLVKEDNCWMIEKLWVDDMSTVNREGSTDIGRVSEAEADRPLTVQELFDEDRLEVMACRYADYDSDRLGSEAEGGWLDDKPNPTLSPKAVALTCILSLRQNDDGSGDDHKLDGSEGDDTLDDDSEVESRPRSTLGDDSIEKSRIGTGASKRRRRNEGCERVIRFCSPTNVASTLTPAHFAQYLSEPWYAIFKEWDELVFHSEDVSADGATADLVVLLRAEEDEEWTSVNWELVKVDDMWLTEKIWVVDV